MGAIDEQAMGGESGNAVVVCTDLSESSASLLQVAKTVCMRRGANLQVVHVFDMGDVSQTTATGMSKYTEDVEARKKLLNATVKQLKVPGFTITPVFLIGNVVQRIRQFVDDVSPELVIMGTIAKRGLERLILGSTAEAILRSVTCPVLTIGPHACDYMNGPIVFPTDFNLSAAEDFGFAYRLAQALQVPLHCVHFLPPRAFKAKNSVVRTVLMEALKKLASDVGANVETVSFFVEPGTHLSQDIAEFARNTSASAIVMGVLRRTSVQSHMPGHETFKLLATAPCPVYTLSHSKEERLLSGVA